MPPLLLLILALSGVTTTVLFLVTAAMGRKLGGKGDELGESWRAAPSSLWDLLSCLFDACLKSIFDGVFRGEFTKPAEKQVMIAFLISLGIFTTTGTFLVYNFLTS